ncbi:hypothetical protein H8M03_07005 [Sphingomonas sabuli]|uniref:PRTase-CE domain-containing protein n=1 Tax=Sphingomonas sabuli TaxID=2764186 RepID=A0A7G9KZL5_9SPHN|nr:hypothetical protein [Sphingomonas sabuli]QNM81814.1 hypothetical protein H8M03_07005 [Sphingomonas sabuli]
MATLNETADNLAAIIRDYRSGEVPEPDRNHVLKWVSQFAEAAQLPILTELCHVFGQTYLSKDKAKQFLSGVFQTADLAGQDQCAFWANANIMDIQLGGNSQSEVRDLFGTVLEEKCGFGLDGTGKAGDVFIYLDDGIFTGNRVRRDLENWLASAPAKAQVHVVAFAVHRGTYFAQNELGKAIRESGKDIAVKWWHMIHLEDRKTYTDKSDVLRPVSIPADPRVQAYVASMKYAPHLRAAGQVGGLGIFSSDTGRQLLETEFLKAGAKIREDSPLLGESQRPLGHMTLDTLGFGSTIVTFRNCPNNAPLALWAGDPWYPLFPRKTNSTTSFEKSFGSWD